MTLWKKMHSSEKYQQIKVILVIKINVKIYKLFLKINVNTNKIITICSNIILYTNKKKKKFKKRSFSVMFLVWGFNNLATLSTYIYI